MALPPSNVLTKLPTWQVEPPPKRQKMSSTTSESTLAGESPVPTTAGQITCSVASEDLSSMVFQAVELQRVAECWASHQPLTVVEYAMKSSLKTCEDTANSLRDTLESLEVKAANLAPARDSEAILHNSINDNETTVGYISPEYELKAAETQKFLVKAGIWKIVEEEFASLVKFEKMYQGLTYDRWYQHRETLRESILRVINQDPEPLADFEKKVMRHFQRDMMERVVNDVKRDLERQWKKYGQFVAG